MSNKTETPVQISKLDKVFHLTEKGTDVKTEVIAGVTTFMTMAYILAVNPDILSAAGMDKGAVFTATALSAMIATVLMALFANYPFVLAPGMGLNAYFAFTVVLQMGYTWQMALAAVFAEGLIFIALSLTHVREAIFNAIPMPLKHAVSAGIGLFIAFIGLQNSHLVTNNDATLVSMFSFKQNVAAGGFFTEGITVLLAIIGVIITAILIVKKVKGNILWGILATWLLGILCQFTGLYVPNPEIGFFSLLPDFSNGIAIPSMMPTFMQVDFSNVFSLDFLVVIFAFLFVDMFDTLGTLIGVASKADMLDKDGKLPQIKGALLADAVGTSVGALCGTSTVTTFVESAAGVSEGGRSGLTALVSAGLFGLALFLSPIFLAIPAFATAPALIIVGFLMVSAILKVDFNNPCDAIPAFICMVAMPFMYSISEGIAMGVISYVIINLVSGKERRKTISVVMYILAVLFVFKYILL
ncbi:MAG: NCS2 family permease [Ruthenibacterium sp.]